MATLKRVGTKQTDRLLWRDITQMPGAYQRNRNEGEFNLEYTFIAERSTYFWLDKMIQKSKILLNKTIYTIPLDKVGFLETKGIDKF